MKITAAHVRPVDSLTAAQSIIEVHTDEGATGTAFLTEAAHPRLATLVAEILVGEDPRAASSHWQRLATANDRADRALAREIAALDIALWDLKAKLNNEPLWRTLGGTRPRANVHVRLPAEARDDLNAWCKSIAAIGIRGVVVDVSTNAEGDARTLVSLRDALGRSADRSYLLDANEQWLPKVAIRSISAIEREVDLTWIESPTHARDFLGSKRIVDGIRSAVCSGGRLTSMAEFLPHLHHRSLNVVQLNVARLGITQALQIADAAYGFELPIALTASIGNLHAHIASALVYCASMEWSLDDSASSDARLVAGWATVGDAIGHGITIERANVEESRR